MTAFNRGVQKFYQVGLPQRVPVELMARADNQQVAPRPAAEDAFASRFVTKAFSIPPCE